MDNTNDLDDNISEADSKSYSKYIKYLPYLIAILVIVVIIIIYFMYFKAPAKECPPSKILKKKKHKLEDFNVKDEINKLIQAQYKLELLIDK